MVSMTAIAKYAGVSQTTVSRVINQPDQVKKETYEKVMAAMTEWGYPAGSEVKAKKTSSNHTIRLLISNDYYSNLSEYISAVIKAMDEKGYLLTIHFVSPDKKEELHESLVSEGTAGVIISSKQVDDLLIDKLNRSNVPFVFLNTTHHFNNYSVGIDNVEAGFIATSYLLEAKHKKVVWVGGPLTTQENKDRFLGFIYALQANKSKIRKKRLVITETDKNSLHDAFESLLALKKKPTAVVAATDEIAIHLINFFQEAGWNVPEDVSIIGIGNSEVGCHPAIALTSVGLEERETELAQEAISMLFDVIDQKNSEPLQVLKDVSLFERKTTLPK